VALAEKELRSAPVVGGFDVRYVRHEPDNEAVDLDTKRLQSAPGCSSEHRGRVQQAAVERRQACELNMSSTRRRHQRPFRLVAATSWLAAVSWPSSKPTGNCPGSSGSSSKISQRPATGISQRSTSSATARLRMVAIQGVD
jgi:hypothetical protein